MQTSPLFPHLKMALKYLENIILLFLHILMSLLKLLMHGAITDEQKASVSENVMLGLADRSRVSARDRRSNSTTQDDNSSSKTTKTRRSSVFELDQLINKWNTQQENAEKIAGEAVNRCESASQGHAGKMVFTEYQTVPGIAEHRGHCSFNDLQIQVRNNGISNAATSGNQNIAANSMPKDAQTFVSHVIPHRLSGDLENDDSLVHRSHTSGSDPQENTSSAMKHKCHTDAILSRINMCLSKSKNNQLQYNLVPYNFGNNAHLTPVPTSGKNSKLFKKKTFADPRKSFKPNETTFWSTDTFHTNFAPKTETDIEHTLENIKNRGMHGSDKRHRRILCDLTKQENIDKTEVTYGNNVVDYSANMNEAYAEDDASVGYLFVEDIDTYSKEGPVSATDQDTKEFKDKKEANMGTRSRKTGIAEVNNLTEMVSTSDVPKGSVDFETTENNTEQVTSIANISKTLQRNVSRENIILSDYNFSDNEAVYSETSTLSVPVENRQNEAETLEIGWQEYINSNDQPVQVANSGKDALRRPETSKRVRPNDQEENDRFDEPDSSYGTFGASKTGRTKQEVKAIEFLMGLQQNSTKSTQRDIPLEAQTVKSSEYLEDDAIVAMAVGEINSRRDCDQTWIRPDRRNNFHTSAISDESTSMYNCVQNHPLTAGRNYKELEQGRGLLKHTEEKDIFNEGTEISSAAGSHLADSDSGNTGDVDNKVETDTDDVPKKRVKHRWRKYGNPNENPNLVRDRMYSVRRREKMRQRCEDRTF